MKEIDSSTLIIRYQLEKKEDEIMERNNAGVVVKAKDTLLNYNKAILTTYGKFSDTS